MILIVGLYNRLFKLYLKPMKREELIQFGSHLKKLRTERKLTQVELAYKAGFDRNYIGMLERGQRNPALLNLIKISEALSIKLSELVDFKK